MESEFTASLWLDGILLGGTTLMWLVLQAAMQGSKNITSRLLATLFCALIFLAGFSFFQMIGIG